MQRLGLELSQILKKANDLFKELSLCAQRRQEAITATTENPTRISVTLDIQASSKQPTGGAGSSDLLVNDASNNVSEGSISCNADIKEAAIKTSNGPAVAFSEASSPSPTATMAQISSKTAQVGGALSADLLSDGHNLSTAAITSSASETYTNVPATLIGKDASVPAVAHGRNASNLQLELDKLPEGNTLEMLDSLLNCIEAAIERTMSIQNAPLSSDILSSQASNCKREDNETNLEAMIVTLDQIMDEWMGSCDRSSRRITCSREYEKGTSLKDMIAALDQIMDEWERSCGRPQNAQLTTAAVNLGPGHPLDLSGMCKSTSNLMATTDGYEIVRVLETSDISERTLQEPGINAKGVFWSQFGSRITETFKRIKGRILSVSEIKSSGDLIKMHPCYAYVTTAFQSLQEGTVCGNCREFKVPLSNLNSSRLSSTCPLGVGAAAISIEPPSPEHVYEECTLKLDNTDQAVVSVYELVGPLDLVGPLYPTLNADAKLLSANPT